MDKIFELSNINEDVQVEHGTLLNVTWQPGWEGSLGENGYMCIYMAESLHCLPETIITLLIQYTPIQNEKLKNKTHHHWKKKRNSLFPNFFQAPIFPLFI